MLQVALCDDEEKILALLSRRIDSSFRKKGLLVSIHTFSSSEALKRRLEDFSFDVYFLDIDMPGMDGVDLGLYIKEHDIGNCIVYLSNRDDRVFETFKIAPLRFIRKNRFNEEIDEAVQSISGWWEQNRKKSLVFSSYGEMISIPVDEILYIECSDKVQKIVTKTLTKLIRGTLSEMEAKLHGYGFIKPHRGYLVNYRHIKCIESSGIILKNEISIPISKYKITGTKQEYLRLIAEEPDISAPLCYKP